MKKKALSLLLSVLLCALLLPVMATAAPTGDEPMPASGCLHGSVTSEGECTICGEVIVAKVLKQSGWITHTQGYYTTVTEAVKNVQENGAVELCAPLTEDVTLGRPISYYFRTNGDNATDVTISITEGTVVLMGKFGTVSVGAAANVEFFDYNTSFKCLMTTKSGGVGSLLSGEWGFKTTGENGEYAWHDGACSKNSLYNVAVDTLPITSVTAVASAGSATLTYGYGETACTLSAQVTEDGFNSAEVTYEWYIGSTPVSDATGTSFAFPKGKAAGTYTVTCVATKDGYSRKSNEVTVTVNPAKVTVRDFTIDEKPYDGSAVSPTTGDAGIALYAALSLSSLTGMALVHKKRK